MINNFWFYFFITTVLVSIIALNSLFVHKSPSKPVFENTLEYCHSEDNNFVYSDRGTAQDICIDEYMNTLSFNEIFFIFIILICLLLFVFFFHKKIKLINLN